MLKDYKQNSKANETLQKLAWALESFDRTDLNCEKFFRYRLESGSPENDDDFWENIDYYKKSSDLNGCFLRGDFEGPCHYAEWYDTLRCGAVLPDTVYPLNPNAYITTYNNNQLSYVDCQDVISADGRLSGQGHITATNKTIISQDEVWGLFMGLALTAKLVDDNKTFLDLEHNNVTVQKWAQNITRRLIEFMRNKYDHDSYLGDTPDWSELIWTMAVPVDDTHNYTIHHGGVVPLSFLFAQAASKIVYKNILHFQNPRSLFYKPLYNIMSSYNFVQAQLKDQLPPNQLNILLAYFPNMDDDGIHEILTEVLGTHLGSPYSLLNLQLITKNKDLDYYYRLYSHSSNYFGTTAYERLPVVYSVLHDEPLKMLWPKKYRSYKNDYLNLLSKATDCGPWIIDKNHVVKALSSREWFYNRWEDNPPNNKPLNEIDPKWTHTSQANGLDYMILHNLYWLGFLDKNMNNYEESVVVNHDYPWWWYGTDSNPKVIKGKTITSKKVVESNGNLTLIASESVNLEKGFEAKEGAQFDAYLKPYYHYISYDPGCPCFYDRPEFDKNYVSKDTVINTGKKSRKITENKTQEKYEDISSLKNNKLTKEVIISPNPFNNQLFIYSTGEINNNTSIQIYNNLGVLVFEDYNINFYETINTSEFSAGFYIVKIKKQDKILTYKIIKQ